MITAPHIHPSDLGLPATAIRKRRRSRRLARIMLSIAVATAMAGWALFHSSISSAMHIKDQSPSLAIIAYALLIVSSVTLVLGFWYLLLAQVERLARIVEADELEEPAAPHPTAVARCSSCHWPCEAADLYCRHCGHAMPPATHA